MKLFISFTIKQSSAFQIYKWSTIIIEHRLCNDRWKKNEDKTNNYSSSSLIGWWHFITQYRFPLHSYFGSMGISSPFVYFLFIFSLVLFRSLSLLRKSLFHTHFSNGVKKQFGQYRQAKLPMNSAWMPVGYLKHWNISQVCKTFPGKLFKKLFHWNAVIGMKRIFYYYENMQSTCIYESTCNSIVFPFNVFERADCNKIELLKAVKSSILQAVSCINWL